jgi:hypothetical protein
MAEKIGKYELLERIGRGGMGVIFKARDPILERSVALKVLSSLEITPEVRARFFREAQACARLSHPNIVTIYDMGEDDGRLFIVMELLEGEELRQLIARRAPLALEDKLSIMVQICDGLHYAHERGVVHRDVKPANILLLRSGQVKIVDFGIAQLAAATQGELTRTGMIMGTLRYMAPEQVRGRADHRSDIFSMAAVSYELLAARPPFAGEDPMQILEQLRTEAPAPLSEVVPGLPPELTAIVARGMEKDPADRFADLGEMRAQLERVQRGLAQEAERVRARVNSQREALEGVHRALAERIGAASPVDPVPAPPGGAGARIAALEAMERQLAERIAGARSRLARVDALARIVEHGDQLLEAGEYAAAALEFEAVLAEVPEHVRAREGLATAREKADEARRGQLAGLLVEDARAALHEGSPALCLDLLVQAAEVHSPILAEPELAALRAEAEVAVAAEEAARRARTEAEAAREQMAAALASAQVLAASLAPDLWSEAGAGAAEAQGALDRGAYGEAAVGFGAAASAYRRFEDAARAAAERARQQAAAEAEEAGAAAARARQAAAALQATAHAGEQWRAGESAEAQANLAKSRGEHATARSLFAEARRHYAAAAQTATLAAEAAARRSDAMVGDARRLLAAGDATGALRRLDQVMALNPDHAGAAALRTELEARQRQAASALPPAAPVEADVLADTVAQMPVPHVQATPRSDATVAPIEAGSAGIEQARADGAPIEPAEAGRAISGRLSDRATAPAPRQAWPEWTRPFAIAAGAGAILVVIAVALYWRSPATRSGAAPGKEPAATAPSDGSAAQREAVEEWRKRSGVARDAAIRAGAEILVPTDLALAVEKTQEGDLALERKDMATAQQRYREAVEAFGVARDRAERAGLPARPGSPKSAIQSPSPGSPARGVEPAPKREPARIALPAPARPPGQAEPVAPGLRGDAEQARARAAAAKRGADQAAAAFYANRTFTAAQGKEREGLSALARSDFAAAAQLLGEAQAGYQAAAQEARREEERDRKLAPLKETLQEAHAAVTARREQALAADAENLARDAFDRAQARQVEGDGLARRQDLTGAAQAYRDAAERYGEAIARARAARAR